ncbi:hypothetical protein LTR37_003307 [Vermiconidia calcicola]|uniref:Uncharacterized protein n=1 Tax=Vermiconidia calcicola TaxID=1690605 RepID=A0ACC3NRQ3_9PEZI|nr:hypothetical protein LTR37_003307 [Vermiconidia calcicola]
MIELVRSKMRAPRGEVFARLRAKYAKSFRDLAKLAKEESQLKKDLNDTAVLAENAEFPRPEDLREFQKTSIVQHARARVRKANWAIDYAESLIEDLKEHLPQN